MLRRADNRLLSCYMEEKDLRYDHVEPAVFLERPNRFIARVRMGSREETVHVKNTGRCRELLVPGCEVWLSASDNPARKTRFDLIAVRKATGVLFNIDSQAPNRVVAEWLARQAPDRVIPEYTFGRSRIDFCVERGGVKTLLEVKGCTLEIGGEGYFPDAPTLRGTKHLRELTEAVRQGIPAAVAFVIQMDGVTRVQAHRETDPAFGDALAEAERSGVRVLCLPCHVEPDELRILDSAPTLMG